MTCHRVVALLNPPQSPFELACAAEVFGTAREDLPAYYDFRVCAEHPGSVQTTTGYAMLVDAGLAALEEADTVIVPGWQPTGAVVQSTVLDALRAAHRRGARIVSICSGAFVLAQAGLLDGRRATTHWSTCELLARLHPRIEVEGDRIYVRDGHVWTSAGVTAGMDLALALVEDDQGGAMALEVARQLVLFTRRGGGQSQFSAQLAVPRAERRPLRDALAHIADHLDADLSVPALARHAAMSPRTFARVFRAEVGTTPAAYVQAVRVEAARRLLETTTDGTAEVARACGFGTVETMHRAFRRTVHTTPGQYRRHFAAIA